VQAEEFDFRVLNVHTGETDELPVSYCRDYLSSTAEAGGLEYEREIQLWHVLNESEFGDPLDVSASFFDLERQETWELEVDEETGPPADLSYPRDISSDGRLALITRDGVHTVVDIKSGEILGGKRYAWCLVTR